MQLSREEMHEKDFDGNLLTATAFSRDAIFEQQLAMGNTLYVLFLLIHECLWKD
jgi:hypothetical protein